MMFMVFAMGFLLTSYSRAETIGVSSVEWITVRSTVVASGKIVSTERVKGPYAVVYETYILEPVIVVKGGRSRFTFTIRQLSIEPIFKSGDDALVFLRPSDGSDDEFCKGKLVPANHQFPLSVALANSLGRHYFNIDGKSLKDPDEILAAAKVSKTKEDEHIKGNGSLPAKPFCREFPVMRNDISFLVIPDLMFTTSDLMPRFNTRTFCKHFENN